MSLNPKVVPFERGADFIHQRAMKNLRDNNIVDAIELMRKAVETSPDNDNYRLELAQLMCDAGCPLASNRLLLDMISRNVKTDECLYGLAINQLNMNNPVVARKLLRMCSEASTSDELSGQVEQLTGEMEMYDALNRPATRRKERMYAMTDEACELMRREDIDGAIRLFERVLKMDNTQKDVHALLAMAYMMRGRTDEAIEHAEFASAEICDDIRALCVSAQVFGMAEMYDRTAELLGKASNLDPDPMEKRMIVFSMFEAGMLADAKSAAKHALTETPCDKLLLHTLAAISAHMGEDKEVAAGYWKRILRIDPDDTVAAYYLKALQDDKLDMEELGCEYQVPRRELIKRYLNIADKLNGDLFAVAAHWQEDEEFRRLIGWCLLSSEHRFRDAAVTLLASMDDEEARSQLREYLMRADSGFEALIRASALYRMRGEDIIHILPPHIDPEEGFVPDGDTILDNMGVGHRQLVRLAHEVLDRRYNVDAYNALAAMWDFYRAQRGTRMDPLLRTETAAAALAYCYLQKTDMNPRVEKLAAQFDCGVRQLRFFIKHMIAVFNRGGEEYGIPD
ncbi:MAG: tetratricopeptide repeat protein [Clostridia bacterium]|nr:tetratricopeptide repeat protein [Clostridia bacterium]